MEHSIPRVIVGGLDPNRLVAGKGIRLLEENGVEVIQGIMEKECREMNRRYYTFHEEKRPYVILKWAQTRDGFIDRIRTPGEPPEINWITDENARQLVHKWRSEEQAILVGTGTAAADDPELTVRDWHGRNPLRLVLDLQGRLPGKLRLFNGETPTLVFTCDPENNRKNRKNLEFVHIPGNTDTIAFILDYLHQINIVSLMVEGGAKLLTSFINSGLWDEARVFSTEQDFKEGVRAPQLTANPAREVRISNSLLQFYHR
jgi:diaminohydroxyphosphoribosylaminopyrimidine deaminase/5-amino-6-(5-phosphoribosylamino)uracil reductase